MEYLHYALLAWLVLLLAGLPICLVALPPALRKYSLIFAPLFGFCYFAFTSYYLFRFDIGGTDTYALSLFLPMVLALGGLCLWSATARRDLASAFNRETCSIAALVLVAFAVVSAPFFAASHGRALATSMGNLDVVEYSIGSRYLQEFVPSTHQGFMGQTDILFIFCEKNWFGPLAIVAIISSLLHAEPYQLQALVVSLVAVQSVGFVYLLAREILGMGRRGSSVLAGLYLLSPAPLYTIWESFGGQMVAIPLMLALFLIQANSLKRGDSERPGLSHLPATVVLLTGILLSYHYMLVAACLLLAAYFVCHAYLAKKWRAAWQAGCLLAAACAVGAVLNLPRIKVLVAEMAMVMDSHNGWFIPWLSPDVLLGANAASVLSSLGPQSGRPLWGALAAALFLLAGWRLIRTREAIGAGSFFFGLTMPVFLVGLCYAYLGRENGALGGYRSFKITASFSALTLLGVASAFVGCSWSRRRWQAMLAAALVAAAVGNEAASGWALARFAHEQAFIPGPELVALKKIESMPFVRGMNVLDADNFSLMWTNYFTLGTHQIYQRFLYGGRPVGVLNQEFSLGKDMAAAHAPGHFEDIFSVETSSFEAAYPISAWYTLYKARENVDVTITPAEGWWDPEPGHRWSGKKGEICSVYIDTATQGIAAQIEAHFLSPLGSGNMISAKVNGTPLGVTCDQTALRSDTFRLRAGRNLVEFRTSFKPSPPSAHDPRTLGVPWTSVSVRFPAHDAARP